MRSWYKILSLFKKPLDMEYCQEFDEIKSILEHCNRQTKPFEKLHFRGGNEHAVKELHNRIVEMFQNRGLVDTKTNAPLPNQTPTFRKILMYILFNTDVSYKYNLSDDPNLVHVVHKCPLLPKFLVCELIWSLQLDDVFYEALCYTPSWFSFQYFQTAADVLQFVRDPFSVIEKVQKLVTAVFISITRMEEFQIDQVEKKILYGKLHDYTMSTLRQYYTPDAGKFTKLKKGELYRYQGYVLKSLLTMLLTLLDIFEQPEKVKPDIDIKIFEVCEKLCPKYTDADTKPPNENDTLKSEQLKIISCVQSALLYNVMLVKLDAYMYWVEVNLGPARNLQMVVGELAYTVGARIEANAEFTHDVVDKLKSIAVRPRTVEEYAADATLGDVLRMLDEPLQHATKQIWFNELFKRQIAFSNDECLQTMKDNISLISVKNCKEIYDYIKICTHSPAGSIDFEDELVEIIFMSFKVLNVPEILTVIAYQTELFGGNSSVCETANFNGTLNEFFNKQSSAMDIKSFLVLCTQNAERTWMKFFECCTQNEECMQTFCTLTKQVYPFSEEYFPYLLSEALQSQEQYTQKLFPQLLCRIYFVIYYPARKKDFFKPIINHVVKELIEAQNFDALLPISQALNLIANHGETQSHKPLNFGEITAPVLVMAGRIMDRARWDLVTYTEVRDAIVRECIKFVQQTSNKFLPVASEKDRQWISNAIKESSKPLTQYYFQKYALTPDQAPLVFDRFLIRLDLEDEGEAEVFLTINFVRCTMKEAEWLARSERLQPHITTILIILANVVVSNECQNAIKNYRNCLFNYAHIVSKVLLPQVGSETDKIEALLLKVLSVVEATPEQIYEDIFIHFEGLLLDIAKKFTMPMQEDAVKNIRKCVEKMKQCRARELFLSKFGALVNECLT